MTVEKLWNDNSIEIHHEGKPWRIMTENGFKSAMKAASSNTVAPVDNKIIDALELNQAWSIIYVLEKMIEAATILLDKKDYDGHGWEEIHHARQRAREIYSNLTTALKEQTKEASNNPLK